MSQIHKTAVNVVDRKTFHTTTCGTDTFMIKVALGDDIRCVEVNCGITYANMVLKMQDVFDLSSATMLIKYKDEGLIS